MSDPTSTPGGAPAADAGGESAAPISYETMARKPLGGPTSAVAGHVTERAVQHSNVDHLGREHVQPEAEAREVKKSALVREQARLRREAEALERRRRNLREYESAVSGGRAANFDALETREQLDAERAAIASFEQDVATQVKAASDRYELVNALGMEAEVSRAIREAYGQYAVAYGARQAGQWLARALQNGLVDRAASLVERQLRQKYGAAARTQAGQRLSRGEPADVDERAPAQDGERARLKRALAALGPPDRRGR